MPLPYFMLPDGDLNPLAFSQTYLDKPSPDSNILKIEDYETFFALRIDVIRILHLPDYFASYINNNDGQKKEESKDLYNYWTNLAFLCKKKIPEEIEYLYKYGSIISLLVGFNNIKEYIRRALIKSECLWDELVMSMNHVVKELSKKDFIFSVLFLSRFTFSFYYYVKALL